jgi:hypothetical protein
MTQLADPISLRLPLPLQAGVEACAEDRSLSTAEAIEELVRQALIASKYLAADQRRQVEAEMRIMTAVETMVRRMKADDDWGDDVTKTVFDTLQRDQLADYEPAVAMGNGARINRQIGARVRSLLNAEVVMEKRYRKMGQVPRAEQSLIKTYTILRRPTSAGVVRQGRSRSD